MDLYDCELQLAGSLPCRQDNRTVIIEIIAQGIAPIRSAKLKLKPRIAGIAWDEMDISETTKLSQHTFPNIEGCFKLQSLESDLQ